MVGGMKRQDLDGIQAQIDAARSNEEDLQPGLGSASLSHATVDQDLPSSSLREIGRRRLPISDNI